MSAAAPAAALPCQVEGYPVRTVSTPAEL
eukprot:SAG22_NODE_5381_length_1024_cov_10.099733_2_plen_28_part_01